MPSRPTLARPTARQSPGADSALDRIIVEVDPDLRDLVPEYLERRRQDLWSMRSAIEQGDYETIRMLGHSMKGSGAAYGFDALSELGSTIELAAEDADAPRLRRWLGELSRYLERVQVVAPAGSG